MTDAHAAERENSRAGDVIGVPGLAGRGAFLQRPFCSQSEQRLSVAPQTKRAHFDVLRGSEKKSKCARLSSAEGHGVLLTQHFHHKVAHFRRADGWPVACNVLCPMSGFQHPADGILNGVGFRVHAH